MENCKWYSVVAAGKITTNFTDTLFFWVNNSESFVPLKLMQRNSMHYPSSFAVNFSLCISVLSHYTSQFSLFFNISVNFLQSFLIIPVKFSSFQLLHGLFSFHFIFFPIQLFLIISLNRLNFRYITVNSDSFQLLSPHLSTL